MPSSNKINRIKILEVVPSIQPGGAENVAKLLCKHIDRRKFDVQILSFYEFKNTAWPTDLEHHCLGKKKKGFNYRLIGRIAKIFRETNPSIIHNHSLYSLFYLIPANLISSKSQIVQTIHSDINFYHPLFWKVIFKLFKITTVSLSPRLNLSLQNLKSNINIPNGIDINEPGHRQIPKKNQILFIGRLAEEKNPIDFLKIAQEIDRQNLDLNYVMIGQGELKKNVESFLSRTNIRDFQFINKFVNLEKYFLRSKFMIVTSRWEGMPLTMIEAMNHGLVVFAKPAGAIGDLIINNKSGFLIDNDLSPKQAAKLIVSKIIHSEIIKRISQKATQRAKLFSVENMVKRYEALFIRIKS